MSDQKAYLVLEDGTVYQGYFFGHVGEVTGEVVFTTGVVGYLETLTDPSYSGQIVMQTFPLVGNYGVIAEDFESPQVHAGAYIVKEWCKVPSNFRCEGDIDSFLRDNKIVGMYGIDTRALTIKLREKGHMNAVITDDASKADLAKIKNFSACGMAAAASPDKKYEKISDEKLYKVAMIDFGERESVRNEFLKYGCDLTVYPYNTSAEEIISANPDGIVISNGPGDPAENAEAIEEIKKLMKSEIPMLGLGLGHQMMALASGFAVEKMLHGHRGANQPCRDMITDRVYITSQNHGYVVVSDSIDGDVADVYFENINDNTCEGINYHRKNTFSVQFCPISCVGPLEGKLVFDKFISSM